MILLDPTTALIYNTDDLAEAVETDNGIDLVYFGANFTLTRGVTINKDKPSITFDGTFEGIRYTFTDYNSSSTGTTLGVRSAVTMTVTFRHIDLVGRNYYGIPYVPNSSTYNGISTIYDDVTYTGIQINHNPYGYTRYKDCNITVSTHEVSEVTRLELEGNCTFTKTGSGTSVFFLYGTSSAHAYMRVLAGASITVSTPFYFFYEYFPPDFIIEPGASLTINADAGMVYSVSHTIRSFLIDEDASFRFYQRESRSLPSMLIDGSLTVNNNARFYMQADFENNNRLIRFTSTGGGIYLNDPKSFAVYNRGNSSAKAFYFSGTVNVSITGGQVNYWETPCDFPDAGTLDDHPLHKWKRPDYSAFTLTGTQTGNTQTNLTSDLTPEELLPLPPLSSLQLAEACVFSVGKIDLDVYSAVITRSVTGKTDPHANVKVFLLPSYYEDPQTGIADDEGLFSIVPMTPMPFSDVVEVHSNIPFLIVTKQRAVMAENVLTIDSAPGSISFIPERLSGFEQTILPRDLTAMPVKIIDTRDPKTPWVLWANIEGPLMTDSGDILPEAVVFVLQNDVMDTMTDELRPVHIGQPFPMDDDTIIWSETTGILGRMTVPIRSGKRYHTRLGWFLAPEGAIPGEED